MKSSKEGKIILEIESSDLTKSKEILENNLKMKTSTEDNYLVTEVNSKEDISAIIDTLRTSGQHLPN